jgi:hypothetical protein
VLSGPGGLASWLRQSQLAGGPGGGSGLPLGIPLPLDTGEAEPTIPAHLRRAVTTRHTHCAFPGCRVPAEACHIHHLVPRARAGPTAIGNLVPLCSFHHLTAVHRWGWTVTLHADGSNHRHQPDRARTLHDHGRPGRIYYARRTAPPPRRYRAHDENSTRWLGFPFRDDDIVISTRSKTGTTWVQMICALLIFQQPRLPAPIAQLSPWLDHLIAPREQVFAQLAAQEHRRFIKTHTPLDGIPLDPRVTYLVTARHPLDVAVSLYHHSGNIDRARLRQLTGQPEPATPPPPLPPPHDWLLRWIADDDDPAEQLDSFPGLMWHLSDAWARRGQPNVLLVHYDNLSADRAGQMRWLAGRLDRCFGDAWSQAGPRGRSRACRATRTRPCPPLGCSRATPRSSAGAPPGPGGRSSASGRLRPTTTAPPGWHRPTCSPGSTRRASRSNGVSAEDVAAVVERHRSEE